MKATEIIRGVLDLIDQVECAKEQETQPEVEVSVEIPAENPLTKPADANHFKQIFDILSAEKSTQYSNSPNEVVAGIDSVTTHAGGGWMGPKDPADLRGDSLSLYPNHQHRPE